MMLRPSVRASPLLLERMPTGSRQKKPCWSVRTRSDVPASACWRRCVRKPFCPRDIYLSNRLRRHPDGSSPIRTRSPCVLRPRLLRQGLHMSVNAIRRQVGQVRCSRWLRRSLWWRPLFGSPSLAFFPRGTMTTTSLRPRCGRLGPKRPKRLVHSRRGRRRMVLVEPVLKELLAGERGQCGSQG